MKAQELKNYLKNDDELVILAPDGIFYPVEVAVRFSENILVLKCKDITKGEK